jgi:hypothetical protein
MQQQLRPEARYAGPCDFCGNLFTADASQQANLALTALSRYTRPSGTLTAQAVVLQALRRDHDIDVPGTTICPPCVVRGLALIAPLA